MPDLLDISVLLPLSAPDHVHYMRARRSRYPGVEFLHLGS
jgi:hypothetical protein